MDIKSIKELVNAVLADDKNLYLKFSFGVLPKKQAKILESSIGINLTGAKLIIDSYAIRHTMLSHGNAAQETKRGQIAVLPSDFSLIPIVILQPDRIDYIGKNKLQQDVFKYTKRLDVLYIVCEAVRQSQKGDKMAFATMYKQK